MYNNYSELQKLAPTEYLNWQNFETIADKLPENVKHNYAQVQYQIGLDIGKKFADGYIFISANGVWGACKGLTSMNSYEGIGYHACTKDLLHGFLDSGTKIIVYRYDNLDGVQIK